jgi:hypothetical protein
VVVVFFLSLSTPVLVDKKSIVTEHLQSAVTASEGMTNKEKPNKRTTQTDDKT